MSAESESTATPTEAEPTAADFEPSDEELGAPPVSESAPQEGAESQADGADGEEEAPQEEGEQESESDPYAEPPEFWSAEHKDLWDPTLPAEVRKAIHEHVQGASRAVSDKLMEAAEARKKAESQLTQFTQERDQLAQWWQNVGSRLVVDNFQAKWGHMTPEAWAQLATENPAECQKLRIQYDNDRTAMAEAFQRHQQEVTAANQRAEQAFNDFRQAEYQKLATKLPQYFASDKAQATYDELGSYLLKNGIPQERINRTVEAPIVEIALKAMLYDKAQASLKAKPKGTPATATQTPRRVAPGARQGQPTKSDAERQAEQRLRNGQDLSDEDVARLFG